MECQFFKERNTINHQGALSSYYKSSGDKEKYRAFASVRTNSLIDKDRMARLEEAY
jgi:hypothetical protein